VRSRSKLLLTLAAPFAGVLFAEIAARTFAPESFPPPRAEGDLLIDSSEPMIRFENKPNGEQRITYSFGRDQNPVAVVSRANEQGFRGAVVAREKPPDVFRIACIGDSHTFGYGVGEGETWVDVVREKLGERGGSKRIEVMNCGVTAQDTEQEVEFLFARVLPYQPDLVLMQFFVNDAAIRDTKGTEGSENDWLIRLTHPRRPGFVRWLRSHLRSVDVFASGIYSRRHLAEFARTRSALFTDEGEGWQRVRAALIRARDRLSADRVQFAVVFFPFLVREDGALVSRAAFATVARFCDANTVACWDLEPDFANVDVDAMRVHPLDFHANAHGHRIFGEGVAKRLVEADWIEKTR